MSDRSAIEWTDASWNPVTGCVEVSPGCDHCYARTFAERFRGVPGHPYQQGFDVKLWPQRLDQPLGWRRPRRVFVNSMSDLFQDAVPDSFIGQVFDVMRTASKHQFQVLTKRPGRMASLLKRWEGEPVPAGAGPDWTLGRGLPLANAWLGTSVEDQRWADIRIPKLLETPARVRFLSCEPLLDSVDLRKHLVAGIDWVIVGGESGHHSRPMDPDWARSIRDQCSRAGVAFFFKQFGGRTPKAGGRELDGRTWDEMPVERPDVDPVARLAVDDRRRHSG